MAHAPDTQAAAAAPEPGLVTSSKLASRQDQRRAAGKAALAALMQGSRRFQEVQPRASRCAALAGRWC